MKLIPLGSIYVTGHYVVTPNEPGARDGALCVSKHERPQPEYERGRNNDGAHESNQTRDDVRVISEDDKQELRPGSGK